MKATIDRDGRIQLGPDLQMQLGLRPGDDVIFENRAGEWILKVANAEAGLGREGNVLVHRGTIASNVDALADLRDERLTQLSEGDRQ